MDQKLLKSNTPLPRISTVAPGVSGFGVVVTWAVGTRGGITESVDLSPVIMAGAFFRPLRKDRQLFCSVHVIAGGIAIAWGDDEDIDLSSSAIERLCEEKMTADGLRAFLNAQNLTETALAALLDYSRRQIVGFANGEKSIPRAVSLACRYIEMQNPAVHDDASIGIERVLDVGFASTSVPDEECMLDSDEAQLIVWRDAA